ncbi:Homeobox protein liguleless 3 [Zea mays]|uniref:Homeobox protein liguleless 3 n=1 Tax=Zea mays TaxID=4577 RepID=A0A1D6MRP1_MAIZE|nr:Homeobox protein liguleless 3 [Zea mays]
MGGPTGGSGWALAHPKPGPSETPHVHPVWPTPDGCSNFHL